MISIATVKLIQILLTERDEKNILIAEKASFNNILLCVL